MHLHKQLSDSAGMLVTGNSAAKPTPAVDFGNKDQGQAHNQHMDAGTIRYACTSPREQPRREAQKRGWGEREHGQGVTRHEDGHWNQRGLELDHRTRSKGT
ncbi:uncharacterized protein EHS24_001024 [Apiotrichum porosum]|uniref:Uncharacterized protein n=1 Tax=Apiotrichum porosum TaxID=105984 RepID=A0A427YBE2_9TREE|nr:uncharacterized protein EHS24_001024 [Apiotrichum porosum]RSH88479.1 hypothetical protein EHS24_001024 [Apiotrichum porosum]